MGGRNGRKRGAWIAPIEVAIGATLCSAAIWVGLAVRLWRAWFS